MKKLSLLLVAVLFCLTGVEAQSYYYVPHTASPAGNPGSLNTTLEYPVGGGLSTTWKSIHSGSATSAQWTSVQTLPFSFNFAGSAVTEYKVSTSGVLTFAANSAPPPAYSHEALPSASVPDSSVCVWGLAGTGSNDNIVVQTFGSSPNRQHWIFFSSYNIENGGSSCWTYWSIVLEETTNKIYVVDMRNTTTSGCGPKLSVGIQMDNSTAYSVTGSPNVTSLAGTDASDADNYYYEFIYGTQPQYDMAGIAVDIDDYLILVNAPFDIKGTLSNMGSQVVTSFDLNYSVNGGVPVVDNITGVNIDVFGTYDFTAPTKWTPSAEGQYTVEVWASNINGNTDEVTNNDKVSKSTMVVSDFKVRMPLHEVFTSSTCAPCKPGNEQLTSVLSNYPDEYTLVKYQMSWPGTGDPYYTTEGYVKRQYYNVTGVPNLEVDAQWNSNPNGYSTDLYDFYKAIPSFMEITATHVQTYHKFDIDVEINPISDFSSNNLYLFVAIVENVTYNNVKTNGETEFYDVMKKMVPDANGTKLAPLTKNNKVTKKLSWEFKGDYVLPPDATQPVNLNSQNTVEDFNNLSVVVWVQDMTAQLVHQSAWSKGTMSDVEEIDGEGFVGMFPNPVEDYSFIRFKTMDAKPVQINIYNTLGEVVETKDLGNINGTKTVKFDMIDYATGAYVAKLMIGEKSYTRKFIVK